MLPNQALMESIFTAALRRGRYSALGGARTRGLWPVLDAFAERADLKSDVPLPKAMHGGGISLTLLQL
jgi:hypothetical protein